MYMYMYKSCSNQEVTGSKNTYSFHTHSFTHGSVEIIGASRQLFKIYVIAETIQH